MIIENGIFKGFEMDDVMQFVISEFDMFANFHFKMIKSECVDVDDHGQGVYEVVFKDTKTDRYYTTSFRSDNEYGVDEYTYNDILNNITEVFPKKVVKTMYLTNDEIQSGKFEFVN